LFTTITLITHPYLKALSALSYGARLALRLADTTTSPAAALLLRPRRKKRKLAAVRRGVYTRRRAAATAAAEPWGPDRRQQGRHTHMTHWCFESRVSTRALRPYFVVLSSPNSSLRLPPNAHKQWSASLPTALSFHVAGEILRWRSDKATPHQNIHIHSPRPHPSSLRSLKPRQLRPRV
jgi:hypothetical protein